MKDEQKLHWVWQVLIKLLFIIGTASAVTLATTIAVICLMLLGAGLHKLFSILGG